MAQDECELLGKRPGRMKFHQRENQRNHDGCHQITYNGIGSERGFIASQSPGNDRSRRSRGGYQADQCPLRHYRVAEIGKIVYG